jgi:hypothetical protein
VFLGALGTLQTEFDESLQRGQRRSALTKNPIKNFDKAPLICKTPMPRTFAVETVGSARCPSLQPLTMTTLSNACTLTRARTHAQTYTLTYTRSRSRSLSRARTGNNKAVQQARAAFYSCSNGEISTTSAPRTHTRSSFDSARTHVHTHTHAHTHTHTHTHTHKRTHTHKHTHTHTHTHNSLTTCSMPTGGAPYVTASQA